MKAEKSVVISYLALGVAIVALGVAVFGNCRRHKGPHRPGHDMHGEMMRGPGPEAHGGRGHREGFGEPERGREPGRPDAHRPADKDGAKK
jgi:hypothetical protein